MPTTQVETATGPLATSELGPTLMHEHIVTRSPGVQENWPHLWDRSGILALAERKMADLHARGIRAIVDLTTVDLGRDLDLIVQVARRSPVRVIVATGVWWMPQRYFSGHGVRARGACSRSSSPWAASGSPVRSQTLHRAGQRPRRPRWPRSSSATSPRASARAG